ncbi:hypothetical protein HORIV_55430 [Vreelandella olivaria]|uniref:Acyl-CoA thioesterase II n=1 Tax=Vreelandella olivaria TaxID=390919 RepID=A0ABM7GR05_9GAMM|nr:hypothetical protein HORIV_55430 [Halomonas olivaria]
MTDALNKLVALLELETLEETLYRGQSQDLGFPQLYGGQVLGQALAAAARTVPNERRPTLNMAIFCDPAIPTVPLSIKWILFAMAAASPPAASLPFKRPTHFLLQRLLSKRRGEL